MRKIFLIAAVLCFIGQLNGQSTTHRWGIEINPASFFAIDNGLFNTEEYGAGVQLGLYRGLGSSLI